MSRGWTYPTLAALAAAMVLGTIGAGGAGATKSAPGGPLPKGNEAVKLKPADFTTKIDKAARVDARSARTAAGEWTSTECGTFTGKGCAPTSARVDLVRPVFSNPTKITNPLFPVSTIESVVLTGTAGGKPFRSETTVLPYTSHVTWDGQSVEVVMSQYLAFSNGEIEEMALDRYAQADDGSVWYLGEDVFDYVDGTIAVSEGTWLAGRDGPPAMIMPAHPKVGDVFRSENVTGVVFEELRVKAVDQTFKGPSGAVHGAVVMDELHVDGVTLSGKVFAPGYGEFRTTDHGGDLEAVAVAVTTDARPGGVPSELAALSTGAWGVLENARLEDWKPAQLGAHRLRARFTTLRSDAVPPRVANAMDTALRKLATAVGRKNVEASARAAVAVGQAALDVELLYRPRANVDIDRMHLHAQQLRVDAAAGDTPGLTGEVAVLEWTAERILGRLSPADRAALESRLRNVRGASDDRNLRATADHAARLAAWLRGDVALA